MKTDKKIKEIKQGFFGRKICKKCKIKFFGTDIICDICSFKEKKPMTNPSKPTKQDIKYTINNHEHKYEIEVGKVEVCELCRLLKTTIESQEVSKCKKHEVENCGVCWFDGEYPDPEPELLEEIQTSDLVDITRSILLKNKLNSCIRAIKKLQKQKPVVINCKHSFPSLEVRIEELEKQMKDHFEDITELGKAIKLMEENHTHY